MLAIIFLLSFISSQSEFLIASVIMFGKDISSPDVTAAVGLRGLLAGDRYDLRWGPFAIGRRASSPSRRCCCSSSCSASSSAASPPGP